MTISEAMLDGMNDDELYALLLRIQKRLFPEDPVDTARLLDDNLPDFVQRVTYVTQSLRRNVAGMETYDVHLTPDTFVNFNVVRGREDYAKAIQRLEETTGCRMELVEGVTSIGDVKFAKLRLYLHDTPNKMAS